METLGHPANHFYEFDAFRLDAGRRLLFRDGDSVTLAPRTLNMLLVLIQHRGTVLSKDELMKHLWSDTVVEENNLTVIISALRKALGENPHQHRYIVTIPGRATASSRRSGKASAKATIKRMRQEDFSHLPD